MDLSGEEEKLLQQLYKLQMANEDTLFKKIDDLKNIQEENLERLKKKS